MKTIRANVFETNSSSTHSIAIPSSIDTSWLSSLYFGLGEFGWSFEEVDNLEYLYTGIMDSYHGDNEKRDASLNKLKEILDKYHIEYTFEDPSGKDYYVDHSCELIPFIDELLGDENLLLRYLAGGRVFTGNDNSDEEEHCFVDREKPTYVKYNCRDNAETVKENPYYLGEGYNWYFKGN